MNESFKKLRPYQLEPGRAVLESIGGGKGLVFTIEIARQGGKNELSSQLELILLTWYAHESKNIIKCSPTFKPQTIVSMQRLKEKLGAAGYDGAWETEMGYIIRFGQCRCIFLSAEKSSNVVGNTAHLLLEVDEAQDVDEEKYTKEFKPMGSTTNATNVLYGTTWDDSTLLEKMKQTNLELEKKDGVRRHFRYDWQEIARYNPHYLSYVEGERQRLGEDHPLFLTQYRLLPVRGGGGFLSGAQKAQLQGTHCRQRGPEKIPLNPPLPKGEITSGASARGENTGWASAKWEITGGASARGEITGGKIYIGGLDLAGEAENEEKDFLRGVRTRQDSAVLTIGELRVGSSEFGVNNQIPNTNNQNNSNNQISIANSSLSPLLTPNSQLQTVRIVEHYQWTGRKHHELYPQLIDLIKNVWRLRSVAVDATGIGQPVASFLREALGSRIIPFTFTAPAKSELGFNLLAAVNSGGLKMYAADGSPEYREFWHQIEKAKGHYRPSQTMNFFVDRADGHDDYLMSLALLVEAGRNYTPREARGR